MIRTAVFRIGKFSVLTVLFSFLLGSCTDFFSTSLAPWAARDPASLIPNVNAGNVDELIRKTRNDPDMSLEVLKGIKNASKNAKGQDLLTLQQASIQSATNATGLAAALISQAGNVSNINDINDAKELLESSLASIKNINSVSDNLNEILSRPGDQGWDSFVENSSADDMAIAAVLLLAGEAKASGDCYNYFDSFDPQNPADAKGDLAVALVKEAVDKAGSSGLSDSLKALVEGLNLLI